MPNPYDELFGPPEGDDARAPRPPVPQPAEDDDAPPAAPTFAVGSGVDIGPRPEGPDALDDILARLAAFTARAEAFSRTLTRLRAVDHRVTGQVKRIFLVADDPHDRGSLAGERRYHEIQTLKFEEIIVAMRSLAEEHLAVVTEFNREVDADYFSVDKSAAQIEGEKARAMDGINLQRKILAEGCDHLQILRDGLADTERRIKNYVNAGGHDNISASEYELLVRRRTELTSGREHDFDYEFFDANLIDRAAVALGVYLRETMAQYLSKLGRALNNPA